MAQEINSIIFKFVFFEDVLHWLTHNINIFPGLGVIDINFLNVDVEVSASLLFK
jgi:hypothetical protein